jgi:hypothetical protein
MGEGSEGTRACSENNWLGSCKAHHFGRRTQEDRGCAKGEVGDVQGWAEGGVGRRRMLRVRGRLFFEEESLRFECQMS